jgi:hypothetical protein
VFSVHKAAYAYEPLLLTSLATAPAPDRLDSLKRLVILRVNCTRVSSAVSIRCSAAARGALFSRLGLQAAVDGINVSGQVYGCTDEQLLTRCEAEH